MTRAWTLALILAFASLGACQTPSGSTTTAPAPRSAPADLAAAPRAPATAAMRQLVVLTPEVNQLSAEHWLLFEDILYDSDPELWDLLEAQGIVLDRYFFDGGVVDLIAGGFDEFVFQLTAACGNSGCWTYFVEMGDEGTHVVAKSVLPQTFVVTREAGQVYGTISGYRHGLRWTGRGWEQFCTSPQYCD